MFYEALLKVKKLFNVLPFPLTFLLWLTLNRIVDALLERDRLIVFRSFGVGASEVLHFLLGVLLEDGLEGGDGCRRRELLWYVHLLVIVHYNGCYYNNKMACPLTTDKPGLAE